MEERFEWRRLVGLGVSLLGCLLLKQERASLSVTGAMVKGLDRAVSCYRCMVKQGGEQQQVDGVACAVQ
jgi:hypothetical protein